MLTLNKVDILNDMNYNSTNTKINNFDWAYDRQMEEFESSSISSEKMKMIKFRLSVGYFIVLVSSLLILLLS